MSEDDVSVLIALVIFIAPAIITFVVYYLFFPDGSWRWRGQGMGTEMLAPSRVYPIRFRVCQR